MRIAMTVLVTALLGGTLLAQGPPERLEPPSVTLVPVAQEADSIVWTIRWGPGTIRGSAPTGWEWQADFSRDDSVGFQGENNGGGTLPLDSLAAQFRSPNQCGQLIYIHARVRALGTWRVEGEVVTETAWSQVTETWATTCDDPPPEPPTVTVDTMAVAMNLAYWHHQRTPQTMEWADGTNGWDVGETVILCWYRGEPIADRWPASCPTPPDAPTGIGVIPDDEMHVRCDGGAFHVVADGFDLDCGPFRWTYDPELPDALPQASMATLESEAVEDDFRIGTGDPGWRE